MTVRRCVPVLLLFVLGALWLFPERFGFRGKRAHAVDGATVIVRDGDTLVAAGQDYRLHGIDAPEYLQICKTASGTDWQCGKEARAALAALVQGRALRCEERARDKFGRIVATCMDGAGNDIASTMAERGLAVSFDGFGRGPYAAEEALAKAARRGLWQGLFEAPASWRARHPRTRVARR